MRGHRAISPQNAGGVKELIPGGVHVVGSIGIGQAYHERVDGTQSSTSVNPFACQPQYPANRAMQEFQTLRWNSTEPRILDGEVAPVKRRSEEEGWEGHAEEGGLLLLARGGARRANEPKNTAVRLSQARKTRIWQAFWSVFAVLAISPFLSGNGWPGALMVLHPPPAEDQPKYEDQENEAANAASHDRTTVVETATSAQQKQEDQNDQNRVHGAKSYHVASLESRGLTIGIRSRKYNDTGAGCPQMSQSDCCVTSSSIPRSTKLLGRSPLWAQIPKRSFLREARTVVFILFLPIKNKQLQPVFPMVGLAGLGLYQLRRRFRR